MAEKNSDGRVYAFGYSPAAVGLMENRSAAMNAAFLLPELAEDLSVLDIGCGPGSITVGLADHVPSGQATGLDIEPSQIELARTRVQEMGLTNCSFDVGSVFKMPYPDASFDVVFGHTILMQFKDPEPVLNEVKRVLKSDGLIAFRELDFAGSLIAPAGSAIETVWSTLRRSILDNDGYPDIGRDLPAICKRSGFEVSWAKPVYFSAPTPEARAGMYAAMGGLWRQADFVGDAVQAGWLSEADRTDVQNRLEQEAGDMSVLSSTTYVEVLARLSNTV
jgi:SAM-dependent methyltransferase